MNFAEWLDKQRWTCHVCGRERLNRFISVYKRRSIYRSVEVEENVRYCNDRRACVRGALEIHFLPHREDANA